MILFYNDKEEELNFPANFILNIAVLERIIEAPRNKEIS
jgi:hypothetical protein